MRNPCGDGNFLLVDNHVTMLVVVFYHSFILLLGETEIPLCKWYTGISLYHFLQLHESIIILK